MEETVIDGYHCESEPIPVSKTSGLHIVERPIELGCADGKKVEGKCGHFSIRGYVAETRKRDWKITWPFSMLDDSNKLGGHAHWLPPLSVSEFRWWCCPNCLRKTDATGAGVVVNCFLNEMEDDFTCLCEKAIMKTHGDAPMFLSGLRQVSQENFFEGRKGETNANLNGGECYPSLYSDAKEKEASVSCPSKDGISEYIVQSRESVSHSPLKEPRMLDSSLNLRTNKHVHNLSISKNLIFHDNNISEAVTLKLKGHELFKWSKQCSTRTGAPNVGFYIEIPNSMSKSHLVNMKEKHEKVTADYGMSREVDGSIKNVDPLKAVTGPTSELKSIEPHESDHEFSESNVDLAGSDTHNQSIAGQLGTSNGILNRKKAQKMRLLTDIIKSEVSGASEKFFIFNRDAEIKSIHTAVNHSKAECDASKDLDLHSGLKSSAVVYEDDKKHIVGKKHSKTLRVDYKRSSLMSWLKDGAGKFKIHKQYGKSVYSKHIAPAGVNSKSSPDVSAGIGLHPHQSDVFIQRSDRKVIVCKKQNMVTRVEDKQSFFTRCQEPTSSKVKTNSGNAESKHIGTEIVQSKLSSGLGVHQGPKHGKTILSKKKKMTRVEDGTSTLTHWLKNSLASSNFDSITEPQGHKKASKKHEQRTSKTCEQESSDDIPMEIVELMAKNQHERRLLNAEDNTENLYKTPETIANMKLSNIMDLTKVCGKDASGFLHKKNSLVQKLQLCNAGSDLCTTQEKEGKAGKKTNGNTHICGKYNNSLLSMNQLERSFASKGFVPSSQCQEKPSSGVQFPVAVSGMDSDRWSLTCMQFLDTYHQNRTVSRESSCGQAHYDGLPIPSNSMPFDINIPHKVDDLCHRSVVCHCSDPSPKRKKGPNNYGNRGLKPMWPDVDRHLQKRKGEILSETNKGNLPACAFSFVEQGNEYHSMMGPLDLYTNDAISAMNLLRLMDQGACSSTPVDISIVGKQDHHKEFFVDDGVFRTSNQSMYPMPLEFFDQNHWVGSTSELLSPMHNIGVLGYSFHDTASDSSKSRRHLGFISGLSKSATSLKPPGKGKTKSYHLPTQISGASSHGFVAQDGNVGNAKKRLLSTSDSRSQSKNNEITQPVKNFCLTEICTINSNPAEFTIPGPGNAYMIASEDLECMNMFPSSDRLHFTTNVDGHKRRRMMKLTAIQGH